ncbi:MAG TPA: CAP domain-containing protein [Thermoanaerobaculia bacterium]|nr:CAP domain-containing protein [Thermoanaerobaculia bacterium]
MRMAHQRRAALIAALALGIVLSLIPLHAQSFDREGHRRSLKQELLAQINRDRQRHGLSPVELDPGTSAIADRYCEQQVRNGTRGHFTIDGWPPYLRYSWAGGNDGLSENAAAWSADYTFPDELIAELMRRSHLAMLAEIPPNDGHRRAILDPWATHVGIGLAWNGGEFRMTEEFLRRYVRWSHPLPRVAAPSDASWGAGRVDPGYSVSGISIHYEPHPLPLSAGAANAIDDYALPRLLRQLEPRSADRTPVPVMISGSPLAVRALETFPVAHDGSFTFSVPFHQGAGVYTVVIWVRKDGSQEMIAASNVSILVGRTEGTRVVERQQSGGAGSAPRR